MRRPRFRFTIRRMLIVIAILAVLIAVGQWVHDRYASPIIVKTYYVGDLIGADRQAATSPAVTTALADLAAFLKASIPPDVWWFGNGSVTPFSLSHSLIVRQNLAGHRQIGDWLRQRRKALETESLTSLETRE